MTHQVDIVSVQGDPMELFYFPPDTSAPQSAVILCQHFPVGHAGLEHDEFTLATAERLAQAGHAVAVPFLFHWWPKQADMALKRSESRDERMVADLEATFEYISAQPNVDASRIGIVGHCWGGRVAWLGACVLPALRACAVFYGGRVKIAMGGGPAPIELAGRIRCPVIGFFGDEDQNPTPADVDDYSKALTAAGVEHTFHRYAGAGHAFQNFPTPDRYRERASEDAWAKLLTFLATQLHTDSTGV
jgi:carboxymethylenebutenolidase